MNDSRAHLRHQLRNHLNTISVNAELLKLLATDDGRGDGETMVTCVDRILAECRQCAALLEAPGDELASPSQ